MSDPELKVDVRTKGVGYHFGGTRKRPLTSVECPKCHQPAIVSAERMVSKNRVLEYAHTFVIRLNLKHEPEITYGVVHSLSDAAEEEKHRCMWASCPMMLAPRFAFCFNHWFRLPKWLRDKVAAAYVPGKPLRDDIATVTNRWIGSRA